MLRILTLILLAGSLAVCEDSFEDVVKHTDMGNADAVFALAEWCSAHNKPTTARQYYGKVIEIDKDHEAARARLGQVKVGDRWVSAASAGVKPGGGVRQGGEGGGGGGGGRTAAGPGPSAKEVKWDLRPPEAPKGDNAFVVQQIERMNTHANDSDDMESAYKTLLRDDCRAQAIPALCVALLRPDFNDLYGAAQMVMLLNKSGKRSLARQLLPFMVKCSEHVTDPDDLETFVYVTPVMRDRRALPRLIELMNDGNERVKAAATKAAAELTLLPAKDMTPSRAKSWWDLNWNVSEQQVLSEQLHNSDPKIAVEAAKGLYDLRDKSIVPVLIKLIKLDDKEVNAQAIAVISKITGNEWSYDPTLPPDKKNKIAESLDKWWKENQNRFEWIEDRNNKPVDEPAKARDPLAEWVQQLASVEGTQAEQASANLIAKGKGAVPALITGLGDRNVLVRRKCNDLLKTLSKQDVGFDPHADEAKAVKAIDAWKKWAISQGVKLEDGVEEGAGDPPAK